MNFDCAQLLPQAAALLLQNRRVIIAQDKISAIEPCSGGRFFVMPPLSNAHDHARTVRMSSLGASGRPLESWLHYRTLLPAVSPYLATSVALARAAMGGAGNVMVHYTRTQGLTGLVDEAAEGRAQQMMLAFGWVLRSAWQIAIRWSMDPPTRRFNHCRQTCERLLKIGSCDRHCQ
jgi:cytosine/adenosine deaminase-related metal-dependent hydrolase